MGTQRFVDALSGADGTQALRMRYDVAPVYPDATMPVAPVRPAAPLVASVRLPAIDPRIAQAIAERAAFDRTASERAAFDRTATARAPRVVRDQRPAATPPPTRGQAARAGYYQGPTPTAIAPAAAARHQPAPARPAYPAAPALPFGASGAAGTQTARLRAQLTQFGQQFGTGNPRTPPAMPSSPQGGRRSAEPASAFQPPPPPQRPIRRRANAAQLGFFVLIFLLVTTGIGGRIIDAVTGLLQR